MLENDNAPIHDFSKLELRSEPAGYGTCQKCGEPGELQSFLVTNKFSGETSRIDGTFCSVDCMMAAWE